MKTTRELAYSFIFKDTIQYIDTSSDPGDDSRWGFTLPQLKALTGKPWLKGEDLKALDVDHARALYDEHYWDPLKCDRLPLGLDYFLFDSAIVHSKLIAVRWLQFALELAPTGFLTIADCAAINSSDTKELITKIENYRRKYIRNHKDWPIKGSLWSNRVTRARSRSFKLAGVK